jgi:crotonobetainyl-CoA:carnitine CoA-transferase CaiB-like acyl-CoA transferase
MVVEVDQPGIGTVRQVGLPVKLGRTPGDPTRPAPAFGEHTAEVLREAGYSEEEVREMLDSGAAAGPESAGEAAEFRA